MSTKQNSISPRRAKIIEVLEEPGETIKIRKIADRTGLDYNKARSTFPEMSKMELFGPDHPLQKILLHQQVLKVLVNIVITNKSLMEALLLRQQEIRLLAPSVNWP